VYATHVDQQNEESWENAISMPEKAQASFPMKDPMPDPMSAHASIVTR
jgi:hypothetical protein